MFIFLITCSFSLILFYKSLITLKPLPSWTSEMRFLFHWFWKYFSFFPITKLIKSTLLGVNFSYFSSRISFKNKKKAFISKIEMNPEMSVLDLPDLVLECILEKLPPDGLCRMANVCTCMRDKCLSDHLWEKHMKNKWGRIIGHIASRKGSIFFSQDENMGYYLIELWPLALIRSSFGKIFNKNNFPPVDSIMSCYLALESGKFWFPAQVYNRENGHVGFMLSCYDAELSYDRRTDTFHVRYPAHGTRPITIETGVTWDRLRAPSVDISPHDLHISDSLNELQPGDHMEIQWRRNKEFPYGWWYGVVGHLETCDGNANYCPCLDSAISVVSDNKAQPSGKACGDVGSKHTAMQIHWCWSSTSTVIVPVGDEHLLTGKTIGKRETRSMDFMGGFENFVAMKRFPCGESFGHLKYSNRPQPDFSVRYSTRS